MNTYVSFVATGGFAIGTSKTLWPLTIEQMKRLKIDHAFINCDPTIDVSPEFVFMAGLSPVTKVIVPAGSLNHYAPIQDIGGLEPVIVPDKGAILHDWFFSGMPDHWDGKLASPKVLPSRDSLGKFIKK
jgi:hypothetical protein